MPNQVGGAVLDMVLDLLGMDGSTTVPPYGDAGVATLMLDIQDGFTIKHSWVTDVIKFRAGPEQRIARNDVDREAYSGNAYMSSAAAREARAQLARYAANGAAFLLGLPHESLPLRAASSGLTIPVPSTALVDWAKPGQRVAVTWRDSNNDRIAVNAVVQSSSSTTIDLDTAAGAPYGAEIMPVKAIHLEPEQSFPRYPVNVEMWDLAARGIAPLDFAPTLAQLAIGPITPSAALDNVIVVSRLFGLIGNSITFELNGNPINGNSAPVTGALIETGLATMFWYRAGVTTLQNMSDALANSANVRMAGTYTGTDTIAAGDDFTATALTGAADSGDVGTGASLTTYAGDGTSRPVWDQSIANMATNTDGIHAMTQILDEGGIPYALGTADKADWFRAVVLEAGDRAKWQWFKLFMATVLGRQKKFWLPTYRADLVYVSHVGAALTIDATKGDITAWWPRQRQHVQITQADGTVTRAKITAVTGAVLTLSVSLSVSLVKSITWLELCRFENADEYETKHDAEGFNVSLIARVVP